MPRPVPATSQAREAIRDAIALYMDPSRRKAPIALVIDTAVAALEERGFAPDTAADLVARVWRAEFEVMGAN